jgi:hypothetical protein
VLVGPNLFRWSGLSVLVAIAASTCIFAAIGYGMVVIGFFSLGTSHAGDYDNLSASSNEDCGVGEVRDGSD